MDDNLKHEIKTLSTGMKTDTSDRQRMETEINSKDNQIREHNDRIIILNQEKTIPQNHIQEKLALYEEKRRRLDQICTQMENNEQEAWRKAKAKAAEESRIRCEGYQAAKDLKDAENARKYVKKEFSAAVNP